MKKVLSILLLVLFNFIIFTCVGIFVIKPGVNLVKESNKIKILSSQEIYAKKNDIKEKYFILQDKINTKYIELDKEITNKYVQQKAEMESKYAALENEIRAKCTKQLGEDGWFEQVVQRDEELGNLRRKKSDEDSILKRAEFEEHNNLDDKKDKELENIDEKREDELNNISTHKISDEKNKKLSKGIVIVVAGILIVGVLITKIIFIFNKLISRRNKVDESWARVEVFLKKRYDLIPNIVETVKGYTKYEKETLESVVEMRNEANDTNDINKEMKLNDDINKSLKKIVALKEDYPDLKADKSYLALQSELNNIENEISNARNIYNNSVMRYKNVKEVFPNNLFSNIFNFKDVAYFEASEEDKENVKVELN